jgi:ABC-type Fe3+ transport system permease subunit
MCITDLPAILLLAKFHQKVIEIKILKWSDSGSFQFAKIEEWVIIIIIIIDKFSYLCFQCVAKYRKSD